MHESYFCALSLLSKLYGNEVYVPPEVYVRGNFFNTSIHRLLLTLFVILSGFFCLCFVLIVVGGHARKRPDFYVDPISWGKSYGCPLSKVERAEVSIISL